MANKNNNDPVVDKNSKHISMLDKLSKSILSVVDPTYTERSMLSSKDLKFQSVINREFDIANGVSGGNPVDFIASLAPTTKSGKNEAPMVDNTDLFTQNIGDIFGYFQDIYKNKYLEMTDLKFISKFIPALGEAVKTTLDSIVSSDDVSSTITRNILLAKSLSDSERGQIMEEIERIEKNHHVPKKLKNVVYKKTLVTGSFYIYAISYKELFEQYSQLQDNGKISGVFGYNNGQSQKALKNKKDAGFNLNANESYIDITEKIQVTASDCLESFLKEEATSDKSLNSQLIDSTVKKLKNNLPNVVVDQTPILFQALESVNSMNTFRKNFPSGEELKDMSYIPDGTADISSGKTSNKFDEVNDTYVKYIDSKNIIPIKIFDDVVGYYHILPTPKKKSSTSGNTGVVSLSSSIFNSVNLTEQKKESAINNIVQVISDGIMQNFSAKFVSDHAEFKNMIAECIIANGIVDNDYRIQFIPANYIIPFIVNENENEEGESILSDSLFPAKLLLSLIVCKMLTYMNKSGNKTIAHVYKGPIDTNSSNQLQRVTRMLQEANITFNDLLSTNLVFSKFTRDSNIQLPRARNGEKLVEFETQEGQTVDMSTDFENKLEQMAILGTGVPSVIMEYVNQADFAKQIVSANIKFAGRVSSLQSDLEGPTTEFYKILIQNSSLDDALKKKCLSSFQYKLPRPKVLVNSNNSDFLQNLVSVAQTAVNSYLGDNNPDPNIARIKDLMTKNYIIKNSPFIDWDTLKDIYEEAKIETQDEITKANDKTDENGSSSDVDNIPDSDL